MVVVGEKSYKHIDEGPIRSVRRTRSPTANADDSSASDNEDGGMRVGGDYQAIVPECNPNAKPDSKLEAMLVWAPNPSDVSDSKIDEFITEAKEKHGYNMEQALGMLFWHKHNVEKALLDLANFTPFPDDWTAEDKVLFEQAFGFHGKSFHRIRQMLPDKSVGALVKFYYSWKKTRSRTSLIDRQAHKVVNSQNVSEDEMGADSPLASDSEAADSSKDKKDDSRNGGSGIHGGGARAGLGSSRKPDPHGLARSRRRKPPRGMCLNRDALLALATGPVGQGDALLKQHQIELVSLKRQVQNNKQQISRSREKSQLGIAAFRIPEVAQKVNGRWTNEELLLAVQGVRKYGTNFAAIAEVIGTKNESLLRSFFVNYKRRYNLDEVLAEHAKEYQASTPSSGESGGGGAASKAETSVGSTAPDQQMPMEVDGAASSLSSSAPPLTTVAMPTASSGTSARLATTTA